MQAAVRAFNFKIQGFVYCDEQWTNSDSGVAAICRHGYEDLSAYLIKQGWAVATPDAPFEYHALESIAHYSRRGGDITIRDAIGHVTERVVSRNTIPTLQSAMMKLSGFYRISPTFCSTSPAGFSCSFCIFFPGRAGLIVPLLLASIGFSPLGFLSLVLAISLTSTALIFLIIEASPANTLAFSSSILSNCLLCLA